MNCTTLNNNALITCKPHKMKIQTSRTYTQIFKLTHCPTKIVSRRLEIIHKLSLTNCVTASFQKKCLIPFFKYISPDKIIQITPTNNIIHDIK